MDTSLAQGATRRSSSDEAATLYCRIRDTKGERVEGNLQLEIRHVASMRAWRNFRYLARTGEHVFHRLPQGVYTIKGEAAGFRPFTTSAIVNGIRCDVSIFLQTADDDRLIVDVAADWLRDVAEIASKVLSDPFAAQLVVRDESGRLSLTTRLIVALLTDRRVRVALGQHRRSLMMVEFAAWISRQIRTSWVFRVSSSTANDIITELVEARLQFFDLASAVFSCPLVRELEPGISDGEVRAHLCRFLATLDSPELDGVHPILVQLFEPQRLVIEKFLRAIQNEFSLRPERGIAVPAELTESTSDAFIAAPFEHGGDHLTGTSDWDVSALRILPIADALAGAVRGKPSWT
jgi:hypothetical protein